MFFDGPDELTAWVILVPWLVFLVYEAYTLVQRWRGKAQGTISMVAKSLGYRLNSLVYVWSGMSTHYWSPREHAYASPVPAIVFWLLVVILLGCDILLWRRPYLTLPKWVRWVRHPRVVLGAGLLAGLLLFPQGGDIGP